MQQGNTATQTQAPTQKPVQPAEKLLSALEELEQLLRSNPAAMKEAKKIVHKEEAKERSQRVPAVKQYTIVQKTTICTHCGYQWERTHKLTAAEYVGIVERDGHYKEVRFTTANETVHVTHHVTQCPECIKLVRGMYREELEHRYLNLLNEFGVGRRQLDYVSNSTDTTEY